MWHLRVYKNTVNFFEHALLKYLFSTVFFNIYDAYLESTSIKNQISYILFTYSSSICKANIFPEMQYFIKCTFIQDISHTACLIPLSHPVSFFPPFRIYFKQSWVIPVYHSTVTSRGWVRSPNPSLPDYEGSLLLWKFSPSCKLTKACFSKAHSQSVDHYLFTKAFRLQVL